MHRLPLFPMPTVLLPGASVRLHIFEPRYRQLVAHVLEGDRRFGLVYHDPDRSGPFDLEAGQVGCVAEIVDLKPLHDGRSLLMAQGVERFRIEDGIESSSLYYEGLVVEYDDQEEEDREELERRTERTMRVFRHALEQAGAEPPPPPEAGQPISFQLARWIRIGPDWQQALLEERTESARLERLCALLSSETQETE